MAGQMPLPVAAHVPAPSGVLPQAGMSQNWPDGQLRPAKPPHSLLVVPPVPGTPPELTLPPAPTLPPEVIVMRAVFEVPRVNAVASKVARLKPLVAPKL